MKYDRMGGRSELPDPQAMIDAAIAAVESGEWDAYVDWLRSEGVFREVTWTTSGPIDWRVLDGTFAAPVWKTVNDRYFEGH